MYFNSHPHEEDDFSLILQMDVFTHFNSHPHEEDDHGRALKNIQINYFNSHPHEEDDDIYIAMCYEYSISTHILTKRMTHPRHRQRRL